MEKYFCLTWKHILCIIALAAFQNSWAAGSRTARIIKWSPPATGLGKVPPTLAWFYPSYGIAGGNFTPAALYNIGSVTSGTITVTLDSDPDYSLSNNTCDGMTLAPGASCTVEIDHSFGVSDTIINGFENGVLKATAPVYDCPAC